MAWQKAPFARDKSLKKAVIFDIDGTLANCEHRRVHVASNPKNWKEFNATMHLDTPYPNIVELAKILNAYGNWIVLCTGREEVYRKVTETWLNEHGIPYDALYMRAENDYREDPIIKEELYEKICEDGYAAWLVVDDRARVVSKWRALGLTCLQAAEGDF